MLKRDWALETLKFSDLHSIESQSLELSPDWLKSILFVPIQKDLGILFIHVFVFKWITIKRFLQVLNYTY